MMLGTKREYLRQLVEGKNRWSRPFTDEERALGLLIWLERGYLPHCDFPGVVQVVTFPTASFCEQARKSFSDGKRWLEIAPIFVNNCGLVMSVVSNRNHPDKIILDAS